MRYYVVGISSIRAVATELKTDQTLKMGADSLPFVQIVLSKNNWETNQGAITLYLKLYR